MSFFQSGFYTRQGTELAINGNFADWTAGDPDNFTVTESSPNLVTEAAGGNAAKIVSATTYGLNLYQDTAVKPDTEYLFSLTVQNHSSGDVRLAVYDNTGAANIQAATNMGWSANGSYAIRFTTPAGCVSVRITVWRDNATATDYEMTNWSLKEIL